MRQPSPSTSEGRATRRRPCRAGRRCQCMQTTGPSCSGRCSCRRNPPPSPSVTAPQGSHKGRGRPSSQQAWAGGSWSQSRMRRPAAWRKRSSAGRSPQSVAVVMTGTASSRAATWRHRLLPPPQCPASRLMTKRPSGEMTRTGASVLLCSSRGATARTAMPVAPIKIWGTSAACRAASMMPANGRQSSGAKRCGADRRHSASVSPDGPRHGAAAMASRRRRASGKAALLRK